MEVTLTGSWYEVLILVLMDNQVTGYGKVCISAAEGLNPCFNG